MRVLTLLWLAALTTAPMACGPRDAADASTPTASAPSVAASASSPKAAVARPIDFTGGAASPDALVAELLAALAKKDREQMERLRVSRDEYNRIIAAGTVPMGQPPRELNDETRDFFWSLLDTRSHQFGDLMMARYGGRTYKVEALRFSAAPQAYDWYTALGEVRLDVKDETGTPSEIRSGWIAEVDGKYKLISFQWDD